MTEEELQSRVVFNIKTIRKMVGLSQEKLADRADISRQMMNDIEGGRRFLSKATMVKLANVLGVDVCEIFSPAKTGIERMQDAYKMMTKRVTAQMRTEMNSLLDKIETNNGCL